MAKSTILLADNDPDYLKVTAELLKKEDYEVITAESDVKLIQLLGTEHPDLAILDVRLRDDQDQNDVSGILLAKTLAPGIPKLLLTSAPSLAVYEMAFGSGMSGHPFAVGFVDKKDKNEALLTAVKSVLESAARRDWMSSTWWSKRRWQVATAITLILAILAGIAAVAYEAPQFLIVTGFLAIVAVALIGMFME